MSTSATIGVPQALATAVREALRAPSIFNTQPWKWRVHGERLELYADPQRQLNAADPSAMMLTLSCGASLHHACVALAAAGYEPIVSRLPGTGPPHLLATVQAGLRHRPTEAVTHQYAAIARRRTDRRPFVDEPVPESAVHQLRSVVADSGAYLHPVRPDQLPMLAIAAAEAAATQADDPAYRAELASWTHRPAAGGDGVPPSTAVRAVPRRVPVRDFAPDGSANLALGDSTDRGAAYLLLFGVTDEPLAWLRAGEALSALLLTAVDLGLSAAPMSDLVEVPWPRQVLREMLAGLGEPYVVVRVGYAQPGDLPAVPRRDLADVVGVSNGPGDRG